MSEWKDTEFGKIPSDWEVMTVDNIKANKKGAIAMGPFGSNITADNFVDQGIPVIRGNNLNDFIFVEDSFVYLTQEKADSLGRSNCYRGDIIFTHRGTIGQVGIIPRNSKHKQYVVSQSGMKLSVNEKIVSPEFVHLFFKSRVGQYLLLRNTSQTGVPAIGQPTTTLREIPIPIPPKAESDTIKDVLLSIQNKITLLRQQNKTLEQLAQTLFKRWFVEFEFPNVDGQPYKSAGGEMVASELGDIPKGWKVGNLGKCIKILGGGTPSTKEDLYWDDGDILWYSPTDLTKAKSLFSISSGKKITELGLQKSSAKLFPAYSLLMTSRATVGEITINTQKACTNQGFITLLPQGNYTVFYLYDWLKTKLRIIHSLASGSTFPEISKANFKGLDFVVPESSVLKKYNECVNLIFGSIENNTKEIQTLTKLRDTLLPKLMSGEIRVKVDETATEQTQQTTKPEPKTEEQLKMDL